MSMLSRDLAYAARTLRKNPAFSLTAMVTIALGIGASTAIFTVVNTVLLRPLPYANAERLVLLWGDMRNRNVTDFPFPPADFHDLRQQATLFEGLAAVVTGPQPLAGDDGDPEQIATAGVTPNFFRLLGARMVAGRDFVEADGTPQPPPPQQPNAAPGAQPQPNAPPPLPGIAVLSHEFWQRRFGGDPRVVGRSITVGGGRLEVVGVVQPGFEVLFPPGTGIDRAPDLYTAMRINYAEGSRINVFLRLIGRLKPGVTIDRAQAQVDGIAAELRKQFPIKETAGVHFRIEPMHEDLVADVRPAIVALMGAVVFVLLIACANVANLLLVRLASRERELAVRAALGGTRSRLIRQLLAESLLLSGAGALLGLGLAQLGIKLLLALAPENLPRVESVTIDSRVLAFAVTAAVLAAVLFGLMPALRGSRADVMSTLRSSGRTAGLGGARLLRNAVVVAAVSLSFVLLIGSGLMLRSFVALQRTDPGYDPDNVLTFVLQPFGPRFGEEAARRAFMADVRARMRSLPGVTAVTAASPLPLDGGIGNARWGTEAALTDPSKFQQAATHIVLPGYFEALRTRLIAGRAFTEEDNAPGLRRVIIDRLLAAKAFPNQPAVGGRLLARVNRDSAEWFDVIGVVDHQRHATLAAEGREAIFLTDGFFEFGAANRWALRTRGDPASLAPAVRAQIASIDRLMPVAEVQPMRAFVDRAMAPTRFALVLIGVFAVIAVALAAVGLYGVLSTAVRQRTAEIGVRMAFGAPKASIFRLVVGQGLRLSVVGIAIGLAAAFGLTRVLASMLVGVEATDPATFVTIAVLFVVIAGVASWLPARRAAGLDPTVALREE